MGVLVIAAVVLLVIGGWQVDLRLHPWRPCRWCGGRTRNAGLQADSVGR